MTVSTPSRCPSTLTADGVVSNPDPGPRAGGPSRARLFTPAEKLAHFAAKDGISTSDGSRSRIRHCNRPGVPSLSAFSLMARQVGVALSRSQVAGLVGGCARG